ncbi:hypothetical protein H310_10404 [Aphanomyces invadans]|uniref:Calponin-homology (CH) domain-containing protein n=1 Tax=Aphanomyces invadans TaxID=157072 RepID=A0A024TQD1_9STRA|nr:hypothetical protein H310_10404 [Aphanomyces invadans]ETV96214.1 hypothetical protein H310_10404 [Aphanomyces invadans]|eukprot:XP_008875006.1 hypothetical protein H310_10404 [Aphanomyces invadans]
MAHPQRGTSAYGLDKQLADKALVKYDKQSEMDAKEWIEALTRHSVGDDFGLGLKSGVILCDLANALDPSLKLKPSPSAMPFKQMENISAFLRACRTFGVAEFDLFETVDLFELKDVGLVVRCLHALGRAVQKRPGYNGPTLGVKEATKNTRQFTEAQIAEARHATSLLNMGSIATMQRTSVDTSGSVTFGADSASTGVPSAAPVATTPSDSTLTVPSLFRRSSSAFTDHVPTPPPQLSSPAVVAKPVSSTPACSTVAAASKTTAATPPVQVRGGGYGLDAEIAAAAAAKYDYALEASIQTWIEAITHKSFETSFGESLRDGQVLCLHLNTLHALCQVPVVPIKIETSKIAFKLMQNIKNFLAAVRALGVADVDCFETVDLFELKDLSAVLRCLQALSRVIAKKFPAYTGPLLPDHSTRRPSAMTPPKPAATEAQKPKDEASAANSTRPSWQHTAAVAAPVTTPPEPTPIQTPAETTPSIRPQWPPAKTPEPPVPAPTPTTTTVPVAAPIAAFRSKGLPTRTNWT